MTTPVACSLPIFGILALSIGSARGQPAGSGPSAGALETLRPVDGHRLDGDLREWRGEAPLRVGAEASSARVWVGVSDLAWRQVDVEMSEDARTITVYESAPVEETNWGDPRAGVEVRWTETTHCLGADGHGYRVCQVRENVDEPHPRRVIVEGPDA